MKSRSSMIKTPWCIYIRTLIKKDSNYVNLFSQTGPLESGVATGLAWQAVYISTLGNEELEQADVPLKACCL